MILSKSKKMLAVMPVYRRVGRYILLLHLLVLMALYKHDIFTLSLLRLVQDSENLARKVCLHSSYKNVQHSTKNEENINWSLKIMLSFLITIFNLLAYIPVILFRRCSS